MTDQYGGRVAEDPPAGDAGAPRRGRRRPLASTLAFTVGCLAAIALGIYLIYVAAFMWAYRPSLKHPVVRDLPRYEAMARTLPVGDGYELVAVGNQVPGQVIGRWRQRGTSNVCEDVAAMTERWPIAPGTSRPRDDPGGCLAEGRHKGVDVQVLADTVGDRCQPACLVVRIFVPE